MRTRVCTKCGETKPLSKFHKKPGGKDGRQSKCKSCVKIYDHERYVKDPDKSNARCREYRAEHKDELKAYRYERREQDAGQHLQRAFDITLADYDAILEVQGSGCAICGKTPEENGRRLDVDHDHDTNEVRGLLCNSCNKAIGLFQDNPVYVRSAANYLESYK